MRRLVLVWLCLLPLTITPKATVAQPVPSPPAAAAIAPPPGSTATAATATVTTATAATLLPIPQPGVGVGRGVVVLATGTAGFWPDVDAYVAELATRDIWNIVMSPNQRIEVTEWLVATYHARVVAEPIVLVGYSQGAGECIRLAGRLQEKGVPVTSLLLLESGGNFWIPANVRRCFNLYTSNPGTDHIPLLRGLPVRAVSPSTTLINWDANLLSPPDSELRRQHHLALGRSTTARQMLLEQTLLEFQPK